MSKTIDKAADAIPKEIFRAYDIRGVVGTQLNEDILEQIGKAIGSQAKAQSCDKIVIARDGRLSGPKLFAALTRGLLSTGMNIIDIGCAPTPVLYFATYFYGTGCGAMLTGSHNPADYNGVKIMIAGKTISGDEVQALYQRIQTQNFVTNTGSYQENFIIDQYIDAVTQRVKLDKKLKIVIDTGNGSAGVLARKLYEALGCDVVALFEELDGRFPNHHPDPGNLENLKCLQQAVLEHKADVGLAFDGDADRLGVVTNTAEVIMPDRQLMLFARNILQNHPQATIVYDVKCSNHLDAFINENNGKPCMWKTGHSYIKDHMSMTGALLAGEMSGHIFFKERWYGFDDALYSGARLLEILANDYPDLTIEQLCEALPNSINTPEINIPIPDEQKFSFIEKLKENNNFVDIQRLITIDGLRVEFSDGWGLVRASNTTPALVLRFEADSDQALERIMIDFKKNIANIDSQLSF